MVVRKDAAPAGTIGGGAIEYEVQRHAEEMLRRNLETDRKMYELNNIHSAELGMICGGSNEVFFLRVAK